MSENGPGALAGLLRGVDGMGGAGVVAALRGMAGIGGAGAPGEFAGSLI